MTFAQLLVVQSHDTAIDRLVHGRTNLPEFAALASIEEEQAHLDQEHTNLTEQRHVVDREQKRLEDDAAIITDRIDRENERLYSGSVTAHKDLQAIQEELVVLGRRRGEIEDLVLAQMELGEPIDAGIASVEAKIADVSGRRDAVTQSLAESQAAIDAELVVEREQREAAAGEVDAELMATYETTRGDCGGIGASRLVDKTCEGCHLQLSAIEIDRIRKAAEDELIRCGECTRILVR